MASLKLFFGPFQAKKRELDKLRHNYRKNSLARASPGASAAAGVSANPSGGALSADDAPMLMISSDSGGGPGGGGMGGSDSSSTESDSEDVE